jgi:hypothetical protein
MNPSRLTPSQEARGSSTGFHLRDRFSTAIRYWEPRRIFYNAILATVVVGWLLLTWPHFQKALTLQSLLFILILGAVANLCYSAVYLADIPLQYSNFQPVWQRWRLGLWLIGMFLAILLTNYWIADEIYPYMP